MDFPAPVIPTSSTYSLLLVVVLPATILREPRTSSRTLTGQCRGPGLRLYAFPRKVECLRCLAGPFHLNLQGTEMAQGQRATWRGRQGAPDT